MPTLDSCFYEIGRDQIQCCLEELEDTDDEEIEEYKNDPFLLKERVIRDFDMGEDRFPTKEECWHIIHNDANLLKEMIDFMIEHSRYECDTYTNGLNYNGDIVELFNDFIIVWINEKLHGENEIVDYLDMLDTALSNEVSKRKPSNKRKRIKNLYNKE